LPTTKKSLVDALEAAHESRERLLGDALEASRRCEDFPESIHEFHRVLRRLCNLIAFLPIPEAEGKSRSKRSTVSGETRVKTIGALSGLREPGRQ
jgi:hypothetical protein